MGDEKFELTTLPRFNDFNDNLIRIHNISTSSSGVSWYKLSLSLIIKNNSRIRFRNVVHSDETRSLKMLNLGGIS